MRSMLRVLFVALIAMLSIIPAAMSPGGGDTGVWILPNSRPVMALPIGQPYQSTARASFAMTTVLGGITMVMPPEMGAPTCQLALRPANTIVPTGIVGNRVTIAQQRLIQIRDNGGLAEGLMVDLAGNGFLLRVSSLGVDGVLLEVF